jgi:hypothetical protein
VAHLNPDDLRRYVQRDWGAIERLARRERAAMPIAEKVRIAIELYEGVRATNPDWPDADTRRRDLETHRRVRALLDRAPHVGTR